MAKRKRKSSKTGAFGNPKPRRVDVAQFGLDSALASSREYVNRAMDRTDSGDINRALSDALQAIKLNRKDGAAYLSLGSANAAKGVHKQAIVDFTKALRCRDNSVFPPYKFSQLCYWERADSKAALGNHADAIADYNRAIEWKPDTAEVYYNRGLSKAELGNHAGAIADYDSAIERKFDTPKVYCNRGLSKAELGNHADAIADYDSAIERKLDTPEVYCNRGLSKAELGNHADAIADYDSAIERNPKYAEAHHCRGQANFDLGDYAGAITDYDRAIAHSTDFDSDLVTTTRYNIGLCKIRLGELENAIADFDRFIDLSPGDPDGYYQRGICRIHRGDWDDAIADFIEAKSLNRDLSVKCFSWIGFAKGRKEDYHGALEAYDCSLALNPDFVPAHYNRGVTHAGQGNHDSAISDFNRVLELDPEHADTYLQRGCVKAIQGDHDGAIADYSKVMALDPDQSDTCYVLRAVTNLRKGDYHAAKADCELAGIPDVDALLATDLGGPFYSLIKPTEPVTSGETPASGTDELLELAEEEIAEKNAKIELLESDSVESEQEAEAAKEEKRRLEEQLADTRQQFGLAMRHLPGYDYEQVEPKTTITSAARYQVHYYTDSDGNDPFSEWIGQLNLANQEHIRNAIQMMEQGNLGDNKSLRGNSGLFERRLSAQGLRIYFSKESRKSLLILAGGVKSEQDTDIDKAMERLADHKRRRSGVGEP